MVSLEEVVVTGMGIVCPIGIGKDAVWKSLCDGRSGVRTSERLVAAEAPVPFAAEVEGFDPKQYVRPRKSLKVMCREIQMGFSAAVLAIEDAALDNGAVDPDRFGVALGCEMFYGELPDLTDVYRNCIVDGHYVHDRWGERAMSDIYPLWMLKYLPNMVACHLAIALDARGPNNSLSLGEASSLLAVMEGASYIQRGGADVVITGGAGNRLDLASMINRGDSNLSHRAQQPAAACRPFDARRDGMVNGEGAAVFVLERRRFAESRGAPILARLLGGCSRFEANLGGQPGEQPALRDSILAALREADVAPGDVGHVNAHGISTVEHDPREAQAIHDTLGEVPVTAPKSFFGNLGAGSGAVELAASLLSFPANSVPVTLNYEVPDPACPVNVIHDDPLLTRNHVAVVMNQSATGQVATIILAGP